MASYSGQFPDPVALVTVATESKTNVMTVGWASPISFNPPILMVSIAPPRFTHDLILEAKEFGVSILANDQKELAALAGTLSGSAVDKLSKPEFKTIPAKVIGAPLIAGARAWIECKLFEHHTIGDHTVFYGEIIHFRVDEAKSPMVLFNKEYYALGDRKGAYP